jgi:hypothetical protein
MQARMTAMFIPVIMRWQCKALSRVASCNGKLMEPGSVIQPSTRTTKATVLITWRSGAGLFIIHSPTSESHFPGRDSGTE